MKQFTPVLALLAAVCIYGCVTSQAVADPQNSDQSNIKPEEPTTSGPSIEVMDRRIDLGDIPRETEQIVGTVLYFNAGDELLHLNKVDGPCACFAGYSGDKILQPRQGGEIQVKFDKSKIPAGNIRRMVRIKTNDPVNKAVEVYFHFNVQRDPVEEELRKLREEVTKLKKELRSVRTDLKKVQNKLNTNSKNKQAKKKTPDTTVYNVNIGSSPALGPENAPVTIVEFADFQCPYCVREYPKIEQILKEYPGKVRVVFKHYPLKFHKKAKPAHAAAELAKLQGGEEKFWKIHDMIMDNPKNLEIADLRGYAQTLGMDLARFDKVVADEKQIDELLAADVSEARKCKVTGTPTILINGLKMTKRGISDYKARIDQILSKGKALK